MKKTLSSIKVDETTISNMKKSLEKLNKESIVEMSENDFRRYCYEVTTQLILQNKQIPLKIQLRK
ncbi:MAG TPA: hypothetical protein VMV95_02470 [Bacillota bacterium]|nr:hypothetical protein [Bacillota bacterium]